MITLKSPREIEEMAKSGAILAGMHIGLREIIKPGISSWEIEKFARKYFKEHGATVWTSQGNGKKKYYYISVAGASCRISSWFYDWLLSSSTRRHSFSSVIKGNTVKQYQSLSF